MSIVILGVDAPKNPECGCIDCEIKWSCKLLKRGHIQLNGILEDYRKKYCPIRELPEKHGRLIDADRLLAVLKSMASTSQSVPTEAVLGLIDSQPVIIEEERIK